MDKMSCTSSRSSRVPHWHDGLYEFNKFMSPPYTSCTVPVQSVHESTIDTHTASFTLWLRSPPAERKILGSNPDWAEILPGSSHTSDLKIGTPVATLQGVWCLQGQCWDWSARCQYTMTEWDGKFGLQLLFQCGSTYNCLSRSVPKIHSHVAGTLSNQPTKDTIDKVGAGVCDSWWQPNTTRSNN